MHPRTLVILMVLILSLACAGRFLVVRYGLLPISEEVVLKRAVAVSVTYEVKGRTKTLTVADAGEVQELLATLHLRGEDYYSTNFGMPRQQSVVFTFPNKTMRNCAFQGPPPYRLGGSIVDQSFYTKLCEIVSRHEGQAVDVLNFTPAAVPPPNFQAWPIPDQEEEAG